MNSRQIWLIAALSLTGLSVNVSAYGAPSLPATTRKIVLDHAESGYRWKLIEAPVAQLGPRQVLVHVRAVSLNRGDLEMLEPGGRERSGLVVASDAAGEILAVGSAVKDFKRGMRVTSLYFRNWVDGPMNDQTHRGSHGASTDGVLAEYLVIDDTGIAPAPAGLSDEEAAALPTAGLTAWTALTDPGPLTPDDFVLVQGTGGVSTFALQFAAAAAAKVIVTSSSDEKLARAKALGAQAGINYLTTPEWSKRVLELTGGHGADVIVDVGGKNTLPQSTEAVADQGTISIVGGLSGYDGQIPAGDLIMKRARAQGIFVGSRADYLRMSEFITMHHIKPAIERVYPLEQFEEALKLMQSGNFVGKIILKF